ncbi:MAG TPA: pyridoxamine 5'-phosphate oxidase family protein [Burkholderiales bacterium]|nr:pyridoxamine 5'-phosphate oxidase family protein [Burkholderiales bacterium]
MPQALRARVLAYLRAHHVMTLATQDRTGPWAAAVFYASAGFKLYFLSSPASRHCRNLAASPAAAATIQEDYADWPQVKGVQLEGAVRELRGARCERARRLYAAKFPVVRRLAGAPAAIAAAMDKVRWYELQAARLYFVDNSAGFGHRDEIRIGPARESEAAWPSGGRP